MYRVQKMLCGETKMKIIRKEFCSRLHQKIQARKPSIRVLYFSALVTSILCLVMLPKMEAYSRGVLLTGTILLWFVAIAADAAERKSEAMERKKEERRLQRYRNETSVSDQLNHMNSKYHRN